MLSLTISSIQFRISSHTQKFQNPCDVGGVSTFCVQSLQASLQFLQALLSHAFDGEVQFQELIRDFRAEYHLVSERGKEMWDRFGTLMA